MSEDNATKTFPDIQAKGAGGQVRSARDPWAHRRNGTCCRTCMFFVPKSHADDIGGLAVTGSRSPILGRCRRHAPTLSGYPAVFVSDWCGDHKLDEEKA